jgi:hypothetical protein
MVELPPTQISYLVFCLYIAIEINGIKISYIITIAVLYNRSTWNMNGSLTLNLHHPPSDYIYNVHVYINRCKHIYLKTRVNDHLYVALGVWLRGGGVTVYNANVNNISTISWWSILLVEEIAVPGRKPQTCHKSLTNFIT